MNTAHGPTFWVEGTIEAIPFCALTTCAVDDPRRTGTPPGSGFSCVSVVPQVTLVTRTGLSAADPSVTRMTSYRKACPAGATCVDLLAGSGVHTETGVANNAKLWQG